MRDFLQGNNCFLVDAKKPYAGGNIRVRIKIISDGEDLPFNAAFSKADIVALCTRDVKQAARWRDRIEPFTKERSFWWGECAESYDDLKEIIADAEEDSEESRDVLRSSWSSVCRLL